MMPADGLVCDEAAASADRQRGVDGRKAALLRNTSRR